MVLLRPTNTFQLFPFGLRPLSGKEVPSIRQAATLPCTGSGNERGDGHGTTKLSDLVAN
jgi:hypothetical protein